jgi:hypothetical protein
VKFNHPAYSEFAAPNQVGVSNSCAWRATLLVIKIKVVVSHKLDFLQQLSFDLIFMLAMKY